MKSRLLSYIYATIGFSDADVDCKSKPNLSSASRGSFSARQLGVLEQGHPLAWSTRNRKNKLVSSTFTETQYSSERSVSPTYIGNVLDLTYS